MPQNLPESTTPEDIVAIWPILLSATSTIPLIAYGVWPDPFWILFTMCLLFIIGAIPVALFLAFFAIFKSISFARKHHWKRAISLITLPATLLTATLFPEKYMWLGSCGRLIYNLPHYSRSIENIKGNSMQFFWFNGDHLFSSTIILVYDKEDSIALDPHQNALKSPCADRHSTHLLSHYYLCE